MSQFASKVGQLGSHVFGDYLNRSSKQPAARSSLAKRPSDSTLAQTPKRPRKDNGTRALEVISLDGTSDTLEVDQSSGLTVKRNTGHQGSQSLRSNDNRHPRGAVDEYRSTSAHAGLGASTKRSRHQKKGVPLANGGPAQISDKVPAQEKTSQPRFKTSGRPLLSQSEPANDRIEDDEAEVTSAGAKSARPNGCGNATYKTSVFAPIGETSSDDELNVEAPTRPKTKLRDQMNEPLRLSSRQGSHTTNGLKRSAESPDVLQNEHPHKRRPEPSSEVNIQRSKFFTPAIGSARGRPDVFRVIRAVCEPSFIYPAVGNMFDSADGASNASCLLLPTGQDLQPFSVTDDTGAGVEALGWITPNLSRVQVIECYNKSPIIKLKSATGMDSTTNFRKGVVTLVEFDSAQEAEHFTIVCCRANTRIKVDTRNDRSLRKAIDTKITQVREFNLKQCPSGSGDAQPAARQADTGPGMRQRVPSPTLSEVRRTEHLAQAQAKAERRRTRARGDPGSEALNLTNHTRQEQLSEYEKDDDEQAKHRQRRLQEGRRNLRSVKSTVPSPTPPPPERWTDKNPNWVNERSYNIPLIYERTTINATDIERLDEGQFLNDEIISFYAKYLHKRLEERNEQVAKKVYVFSSFFWEKLRSSGYDGVKNWTTKVDVSSFDYIVVPINQSAHWYLAIICNPWALLPRENADQEGDAEHSAAAGQKDQDEVLIEADAKLETVTKCLADVSFDEQQADKSVAIDLEDPKATSSAKKAKPAKRGPGPRKYHPKDPRVIVLDSLDGAHTNVASTLKIYLKNEIKQRKKVDIEVPQQFGMAAKDIPFQTNFTDCGVYLLGYLEEFMKDPYEFTKNILQHESRTWDVNASAMRNQIRELIFHLQSKYQKELKRQKREKMLASKQKKATSQTPPAVSQASSPRLASEQSAQASPTTRSPIANSRQRTPAHALSSPTRQVDAAGAFDQRSATVSPPPSQRKQPSSKQTVAKPRQMVPSSQSPESGHRAAHVNGSIIGNPILDVKSKISTSPQQEQTSSSQCVTRTSSVSETSSSSDSGSEGLNANASMIVHVDQSMEAKEGRPSQLEQISSSQAVTKMSQMIKSSPSSARRSETTNAASPIRQRNQSVEVKQVQTAAEQDLILRPQRPVELVETIEQIESIAPSSSGSPTSQTTPRPAEPPTELDGNFDERRFMKPIASSSPPPCTTPNPSSETETFKNVSKGRNDRDEVSSIKTRARNATPRQNGERSRYWTSDKQSSTNKATAQHDQTSQHTAIPSSSTDENKTAQGKTTKKEEGKRHNKTLQGKRELLKVKGQGDDKRSKSSPTIDLTVD